MRSPLPLFAVVGVAALALTACAPAASTGSPGKDSLGTLADGKTFTVAFNNPGNLDPITTTMTGAQNIGRFLWGTLIDLRQEGPIVSGLAEKWEADTTTATFTLHKGLTCDDGTPLTAKDIAAEFNHLADPATGSPLAASNYLIGTTAVADEAARTVTVSSTAPNPFLLENLGTVPIVCGNVLKDADALSKGKGATGLFTMTEIVPNSQFTMTRRTDTSWGPGDWDPKAKGLPEKVVVRIVDNPTTSTNMLISGELTAASVVGPDLARVKGKGFFEASATGVFGQLSFNEAEGRPTSELAVRKALIEALDLPELRSVVTSGDGVEPSSIITMGANPCRSEEAKGAFPKHDAAAAAKALDEAGWKKGSDGVRVKDGKKLALTFASPSSLGDPGTAVSELVLKAWTDLGVKVDVRTPENNALQELLFVTSDWDVSAVPLQFSLPTQLTPYVTGPAPTKGGSNIFSADIPEYAKAVAAAMTKPSTSGCGDWKAAEKSLYDSLTIVPYAGLKATVFADKASFESGSSINPATIRMYE